MVVSVRGSVKSEDVLEQLPLKGLELIKQFDEGAGLAHWGLDDKPVQSIEVSEPNEPLSHIQSNQRLCRHLSQVLMPHLVGLPGWHELNENQQGALLSFGYSLGDDLFALSPQLPLARALRNRRLYLVPDILEHCYGTHSSAHIVSRRQAEARLFQLEIGPDSYTVINRSRQLSFMTPPMEGPDVRLLQTALVGHGYEIELDGVFGPITQWAIEKFQTAVGLSVSGVTTLETQRVLHARALYLSDPYLVGSDVREVQSQLRRIGYEVSVDGIFGLRTWRAVIAFQRYFGLAEDGVLQLKSLAQLLYWPEVAQVV
ncbi:MAG: peptidoglycan-binding protein [Cyanobacteria bacterium J06634_5]